MTDTELSLAYRRFSLSLAEPLETADGAISAREGILVRLVDDGADGDSAVGYGEATPLPGWTESLDDCERALERAQAAIRSGGPSEALEVVDQQVAARHAVSLALVGETGRPALVVERDSG